ncbi:MAG: Histidine kinase, gyrase and HSP90-like ATPase [Streptosporangiaceae bacterium]|nr:Histidine kinase, gyrase and HSP90-like ATPase [Streptosporangiaceae bacterium]
MMVTAFWCAIAGLIALAVLLVRERQITARLRGRKAELHAERHLRDEELRHLVASRLPALVEALYGRPVEVPGIRHRVLAGTAYEQDLQNVMGMFADSVESAKARADQSAKSSLKAMMRAVQSLASEQQLVISDMQERHDDPDVLEDLLRIDHANAQLGRRAQATAVLCGSWPGQQRADSSITDVVRGATSRIRDYLRIEVNSQITLAVVSRVVEPLVLAIAELLDNGARHSQPNTSVQVNFQSVHNGLAVIIDDAGVAMDTEEMERAARLLSGRESVDINRLGDPPQVGFAVVGVLAARYGFSVSVDTRSPYGGVRAVVFLPTELLTRIESNPRQPAPVAEAPAETAEPARERDLTAGGLPKRRRVRIGEQSQTGEQHVLKATMPGRPAWVTAAGMGAWQRGTRSGRAAASPDSEGNPQA